MLTSIIGNILAMVTEPPLGISNTLAKLSANESASITAHSVRVEMFEFNRFCVLIQYLRKKITAQNKRPCGKIYVEVSTLLIKISLRRHYPYQVIGFDSRHLSLAAPLTSFCCG